MTIELNLPPEAEPVQCEGCDSVYRADEVFDGLCHHCYFLMEEELEDDPNNVLFEQADRMNEEEKLRF